MKLHKFAIILLQLNFFKILTNQKLQRIYNKINIIHFKFILNNTLTL